MLRFVQFMHPGVEAVPDREASISWNRGDHRRKFLKCDGIRLDENLRQLRGDIVFWGEWEPESEVVKRIENPLRDGPRYVYNPYYVIPRPYENLQNTDPYVFGSEFRYSLCQQPSHSSLRNLEKGSVILFGSRKDNKFVLDTVFVASENYVDFGPQNCEALLQQVDETYKVVTLDRILTWFGNARSKTCSGRKIPGILRSYRGATFDKPVNGMFSFFPCQPYNKDSLGFARPTIRMEGICDKMARGIKNNDCDSQSDIRNYWENVVEQVTRKCFLGIFAESPKESKVSS